MKAWLVFIIGGALTYATRASFLMFGDRIALPERLTRSLRFVAPAAFAAISIPLVLGDDRFGSLGPPSAEVLAAFLAFVVIYITRNMAICLGVGMVTLWLFQWVGL